MSRPVKTEPLGSPDVAWLRMESPANPMTVAGLLVLEQPIGLDELKRLLGQRLLAFERFAQRIRFGSSPAWITDLDFELARHIRTASLPPPGDKPALEALVSRLLAVPLDLGRPPWAVHLVEDYRGGSAVIVRLHHAIADGIALVRVLLSLGDEQFATLDLRKLPRYGEPPPQGSRLARLARPLGRGIRRAGRAGVSAARTLVQRPGALIDVTRSGLRFGAAAGRIALLPRDTATRFKGEVGMFKHVAWSEAIPLAHVKRAGRTCRAKINDVLICAVAGGLRRYLLSAGEPVDDVEIGMVIPVNLRPPGHAFELGNRFGIVFLHLPLAIAEPRQRLLEVQRRMDRLKESAEPLVAYALLRAIGAGPKLLHRAVVKLLSSKCSGVITNVPGPKRQLHLGGRPISAVMFWVPRAGNVGLGISIISYAGHVRLGVVTDESMARDPEAIIDGLQAEFDEL